MAETRDLLCVLGVTRACPHHSSPLNAPPDGALFNPRCSPSPEPKAQTLPIFCHWVLRRRPLRFKEPYFRANVTHRKICLPPALANPLTRTRRHTSNLSPQGAGHGAKSPRAATGGQCRAAQVPLREGSPPPPAFLCPREHLARLRNTLALS